MSHGLVGNRKVHSYTRAEDACLFRWESCFQLMLRAAWHVHVLSLGPILTMQLMAVDRPAFESGDRLGGSDAEVRLH